LNQTKDQPKFRANAKKYIQGETFGIIMEIASKTHRKMIELIQKIKKPKIIQREVQPKTRINTTKAAKLRPSQRTPEKEGKNSTNSEHIRL